MQLVDSPFDQGRIAVANVFSDVYAMGIDKIDQILMILGVSTMMTPKEQEISTNLMIKGFDEAVLSANSKIVGGQSVMNKVVMIGGTAISIVDSDTIIKPSQAQPGDALILTKPIGAQIVVNFNQYFKLNNDKWQKLKEKDPMIESKITKAYDKCVEFMARLNMNGARMMQKHKAHGATDITGFGIRGHAENLVKAQRENVDFVINNIPVYEGMKEHDGLVRDFKFFKGEAAETSGGLLIALPKSNASEFIKELMGEFGEEAWLVGEVVKGKKELHLDMSRVSFDLV